VAAVLETVPLTRDPAAARRILPKAFRATPVPGETPDDVLSALDELVASGAASGQLFTAGGEVVGIALWEPPMPVGRFVLVVYLEPEFATVEGYRSALGEIERVAGPIAFIARPLAGISAEDETGLMEALGFARFGRSEMRYPPALAPPSPSVLPGLALRPPTARDRPALYGLHQAAYDGGLDRYLFVTHLDPVRDAERAVDDVFAGRHGELLVGASIVAEERGDVLGACLVVRASYGPLIVDVMVDPARQGRGLGRAMVAEAVRRLRLAGETVVALNVTEGNVAANRAYSKVGFVRTIGPQWGWFARGRIPVRPGRA